MSDPPSRLSALTVLGGPLHGRTFPLRTAGGRFLIGSGPDCQGCLELPGVDPAHARRRADRTGNTVHVTGSPRGVFVNFDAVKGQRALVAGDVLRLGSPNDPESVMIRLTFDAWAPPAEAASAPSADDDAALIEERPTLDSKPGAPEPAAAEEPVLEVEPEAAVEAEPVADAEPLVVVDAPAEAAADEFQIEASADAPGSAPAESGDAAFFVDESIS